MPPEQRFIGPDDESKSGGSTRVTDRGAPPPYGGTGYRHDDPATDAALDWFLRLQAEQDAEISAAFRAWRDADPRHAEAFARLQRLSDLSALHRATERDAGALAIVPERLTAARPKQTPTRRRLLAWAACLVGAFGLAGWWLGPDLYRDWRSDYRTASGARLTVTLPDGSTATLNTASAIALDFADGRRRVALLAGEAFFDVRLDAAHPFVVTSRFADVAVKGTAFAVARQDAADTVVLERGAVAVERIGGGAAATLAPGQMVVASAAGLSPVGGADVAEALAWREGRIVFRDRPLAAALAELARYYPGTVWLANGALGERRVSGHYRIDDAAAAIRTLAAAAGGEVRQFPGKILVLR